MEIDARTIPAATVVETDVCIVGGGAAGITLARELIGQSFKVTLLESGGFVLDGSTQALYSGENVGRSYLPLDGCRLRFFGGTTNHWGGFCRPLDPVDFRQRDWVPDSGWPFDRVHLEPYYQRAHEVCELGPMAYEAEDWATPETPPLPLPKDRVVSRCYQNSTPTRFGLAYREQLLKARNVDVMLHANAVEIETDADGRTVRGLRVAALEGNEFRVKARTFILATGGIENARLLLASNRVRPRGLGNDHDLVGRYFMEHPTLVSGAMIQTDASIPTGLYRRHYIGDVPVHGFLTFPEAVQAEEGMLNCGLLLHHANWGELSPGVESLGLMLRGLPRGDLPRDLFGHLGAVVSEMDQIAAAAYGRFRGQRLFRVAYWSESVPNRDSRVLLGPERDALGLPKVRLDWRLSELDKFTMERAHTILAHTLGSTALGRLRIDFEEGGEWPENVQGSFHHIGTTRMHADPRRGVVDPDGRVHGVDNLYIAGSSVFPTAGSATPTLTITALALRLADHLKGVMA